MLFNSYAFILVFMPVVFFGFFGIAHYSRHLGALWLFGASVFFYGWWNPAYVGLLLASILFNYSLGSVISREHARGHHRRSDWGLGLGIAVDLALLGYYKYANFFVASVDNALQLGWHIEPILLPIGISFFTFTQIAFLIDAHRGEVKEPNIVHYGLFVTYFPHLIAGPVLHHSEMMPQFGRAETSRMRWENLSVGLTIFTIGLVKKVVLADGVAPIAGPVFAMAAEGQAPTLLEAWAGALGYTFQLYFDFSGYSDMAIGLSRLFGIRLPLNFDSPYKSVNVIEFWRRWHMTLSRFLRDYLYFSLGGNRKGLLRRHVNLFVTMVLGGLWHGANWTFVAWGALHGSYLVINHAWQGLRRKLGHDQGRSTALGHCAGVALTFLVVVVGWVLFRAVNLEAAAVVLKGMAGLNGFTVPAGWSQWLPDPWHRLALDAGVQFGKLTALTGLDNVWKWIIGLWLIAWFAPNTQEILAAFRPSLAANTRSAWIAWNPGMLWVLVISIGLIYSLLQMGRVSEFLYFQF